MIHLLDPLDPLNLDPSNPNPVDLAGLLVSQVRGGLQAFNMVQLALGILTDHLAGYDVEVDASFRRQAREQRAHIEENRRLPVNPKLPEDYIHLGATVDRVLWLTADTLDKAIGLAETPERVKTIREMREAAEHARAERIAARREQQRLAAAASSIPAPTKAEKRAKQEPKPRCTKCGKRPPVSGALCAPCAAWAARHG